MGSKLLLYNAAQVQAEPPGHHTTGCCTVPCDYLKVPSCSQHINIEHGL